MGGGTGRLSGQDDERDPGLSTGNVPHISYINSPFAFNKRGIN
jgi:hypothetical protein